MQKILLFPLRLAVGYGLSPRLLGLIGIFMLVILRLTIGAHFLSEGLDKKRAGNWDASPFFANAKGPFAEHFHQMVWDHDGEFRRDVEGTKKWMGQFGNRVIKHYGFDQPQKLKVKEAHENVVKQVQSVLDDNAADLEEYALRVDGLEEMKSDPARTGGGLKEQIATYRRETLGKLKPTLAQIDQVWENYETTLNNIATAEQQSKKPPVYLTKKPLSSIDTTIINQYVPYFDMAIGICLLFGLFTPIAALAAAGFLGSVFLSQFPPASGPGSTYYQLIEAMACLVLAGTAAGRFGGVDYILHMTVRKVWGAEVED